MIRPIRRPKPLHSRHAVVPAAVVTTMRFHAKVPGLMLTICVLLMSLPTRGFAEISPPTMDADTDGTWMDGLRAGAGGVAERGAAGTATVAGWSPRNGTDSAPVAPTWLDKLKKGIHGIAPPEVLSPPTLRDERFDRVAGGTDSASVVEPATHSTRVPHLPKGNTLLGEKTSARSKASGYEQYNRSKSWSWHDAQRAFAECSPEMPGPRPDKYMVWVSTSALGNGLNIFMHAFVFALVSGRQLVVGPGTVPSLLCGPKGAFHCGIPTVEEVWGTERAYKKQLPQMTYRWNRDAAKDSKPVWESAVKWYQYGGVSHVLYFGKPNEGSKLHDYNCLMKALRCPSLTGLDREACAMVRAMQLLLPGVSGAKLRSDFVKSSLGTADRAWLGDIVELERVLTGDTAAPVPKKINAYDEPVFFDRTQHPVAEASTRFSGSMHIRGMPPHLENEGGKNVQGPFQQFEAHIVSGRMAEKFWSCVVREVANAYSRSIKTLGSPNVRLPPSFFLATDTEGICPYVHEFTRNLHTESSNASLAVAHGGDVIAPTHIVCMSLPPVHLSKTKIKKAPVNNSMTTNNPELTPRETVILDWYLLSRSRWLTSIARRGGACTKGAGRGGNHGADKPGKSFYGWALALSRLTPPPEGSMLFRKGACDCGVGKGMVSIF